MLHHVCRNNPKQWYKLLPLVLWCIRESKNQTLGVSPYMMVFGRNPSNPLGIIKDSWTGKDNLPLGSKPVTEFLSELQKNLKEIHDYADKHTEREQQRYLLQYNKRASPKRFEIGQQVIVLLKDSPNKFLHRWQGPAMILDHKAPQSYLVELDRGQRRWLHANKLRPYHVRVNAALEYNCAIVYDEDKDFGTLPGATVCNDQALPSSKVDLSKLSHLSD